MIFRRKLLAVFALMVFVSVASVAGLVLLVTRNAFEKTENERISALVTQFQREFTRQGEDVARRVETIARSEAVSRMAAALNPALPGAPASTAAGFGEYLDLARIMAESHQLDFLEFVDGHGTIISSAQWPAKFGYPEIAFDSLSGSSDRGVTDQGAANLGTANPGAFLKQEELQDSTALGLFAVRATHVGDHS